MSFDGEAFGRDMTDIVRGYVERELSPLRSEVSALKELLAKQDIRSVADALIDREGVLVLTLSDGSTKQVGKVVGKDGDPGQPGFNLEDFDCQAVDERTVKLLFQRDGTAHSFELKFPVVVDQGIWKEGQSYERGDAVTWAGSLWIAQKDTTTKPDGGGWRLAVKRGRDGKDAR